MNTKELQSTMAEKGISIKDAAEALKINESTLYRKMKRGEDGFSLREIQTLVEILNISNEDAYRIFFNKKLA